MSGRDATRRAGVFQIWTHYSPGAVKISSRPSMRLCTSSKVNILMPVNRSRNLSKEVLFSDELSSEQSPATITQYGSEAITEGTPR